MTPTTAPATVFLGASFSGAPDSPYFTVTFFLYLLAFLVFSGYAALKRQALARVGTGLLAVGVLAHTAAIAVRWDAAGHVPFSNMYEYANIMAWMAVVSFLIILWRFRKPMLGVYVSPLVVVLIVSASLLPNDVSGQLVPALQSYWLPIHVVLAALGEGAFLVATAASVMYLVSRPRARREAALAAAGVTAAAGSSRRGASGRRGKGGKAGQGGDRGEASGLRVPGGGAISLEVLDDINYKAISIGYPLFTVGGLFAGAIWAYSAWGSFWSWDPKEVGALVIWLFYTLFIHARYHRGWRGTKAAWMSVIGFVMILLSFFGNIFLGGQHAYG